MKSKTFKTAHLSALLATNTNKSAYVCAEYAIKLISLGASETRISEFACNGYKNEYQDKLLNKLSRENPAAANEYSEKLQTEGAAYCDKRGKAISKKVEKIAIDLGLTISPVGLSGLCWIMPNGSEYFI